MPKIIQLSFLDGKPCTKCKEWKPLSSFNRNGRYLRSWCVECNRQYKAALRDRTRDKINARRRVYYAENSATIRGKQKAAYDADPEKYRARSNRFREKYHEKANFWARRNHHRHRDERRQRSRAYYEAHKPRAAEYRRRWVEQNRARYRANLRRAKGRRRDQAAGATYRECDWVAMREWFGNVCLCCGQSLPLQADHVIALARGGTNTIENLQPLCGPCNRHKATKSTDYRDPTSLAAFLESINH